MIQYRIATKNDIELLMQSRLEMLQVVNNLSADYQFSPDFIDKSRALYSKCGFVDSEECMVLTV